MGAMPPDVCIPGAGRSARGKSERARESAGVAHAAGDAVDGHQERVPQRPVLWLLA